MPKNELVKGIDLQVSQATFNAAGSTSGAASAMEVHDLDGVWHSGTLPWASLDLSAASLADITTRPHSALSGIGANDHHNQAHVLATNSALGADHTISGATSGHVLRASSATAAAFAAIADGDLPSTIVRTSRTITSGAGLTGGGDLSADRTLAIGAGNGITVNADDVALASSTAGAGLTYTTGVLAVGAGLGITVNADDVALASSTAGAGLTYTSGVLAVGAGLGLTVNADDVALTTPGTLTVATTNAATGSHTHAVTSSSNPGAAASILASTASGGLTLQSLAVQGSVDITSGGDLTVGANILFVDVSQVSVGINGAPDPQFALDVYGPARAEYWIGPHALQIKNALLIAHYDGRQPFESNFSGESNGHMGQVASMTGGITWREGKFNKAIQVAEATTNLVTNPSFETGTTGWTYTDGDASGTAARTQDYSHSGAWSVRLFNTATGGDDHYNFNVTGLTASTTYTISAWVNCVTFVGAANSSRGLFAYDTLDAGATAQTATLTAVTDGWVRKSVAVTTTATGGSHTIQIRLYAPNGYTAWDSVQLEQKSAVTPYCDGSLGGYSGAGVADGTGHSWSGTAHASSSSRTVATMTYPSSGNLNWRQGTIAAWINPARSTGTQTIMRATGTTAGNILLRLSSGALNGFGGTLGITGSGTISAEAWTHVAMTYTGATVTLYVNGVSVGTGASAGFSGMPTAFFVGCNSTSDPLDGLIDDLLITSDVKTATEILAIYESNAPVFAETAKYGFRATPKSLVWADDEGLWMRNTSGQAVFGIYGDDSTTKSWGGLTLASGDLLIGDDSRGGYALWDDSASSLTVEGILKILGTSSFEGAVTLATGGGIYQGTGTFASPITGLKLWNDSGVGRIGGYNTGTLQWYGATDGKLYAGGGNTVLDTKGIGIVLPTLTSDAFVWTNASSMVSWHDASPFALANTKASLAAHYNSVSATNNLQMFAHGDGGTEAAQISIIANASAPGDTDETEAEFYLASFPGLGSFAQLSATTINIVGTSGFAGSTTLEGSVVVNDTGNTAYDFRAESDTEANMIWLDSSADLVYLGGSTNGLKVEKGGVVSFIGTAKIKDATNIALDTTTGTKIATATTQKLGFWNATPIVRPSAFTQTYATASKTHSNLTYVAPAAYGAGANGYSTAAMAAAVHAAVIALAADVANVKQVLNSVIDDLQSMGLLA